MVIFPLAPDQTIAQMWSNGARGGSGRHGNASTCMWYALWRQPQCAPGSSVCTLYHRAWRALVSVSVTSDPQSWGWT